MGGPKVPKIDGSMFDSLQADDPARSALQALIDAGAAVVDRKAAVSPFDEALAKVKTSSAEMVKAQNQLYHQRNCLKVAREKVQKIEELVTKCEQESRAKIDENNQNILVFEKLSVDNNLKSLWAKTNGTGLESAGAGTAASEEVLALKRQIQAQAEQVAQLTAQLKGAGSAGSPAAPGSAGDPSSQAGGPAGGGPAAGSTTAASPAGVLALTTANAGALALITAKSQQQGHKRFRPDGGDEDAGGDANMEGPPAVPGAGSDMPGQSPAEILAAAKAASAAAEFALAQLG